MQRGKREREERAEQIKNKTYTIQGMRKHTLPHTFFIYAQNKSYLGTEELNHLEMVGAIVHQLTRNLKDSQIQDSAFAPYFVDHTTGVYPQFASGTPWTAATMQVKGDPITDLTEDLAAEQKARTTYDNILRLSDDPDVNNVIKFLREREVVHFQRFGEAIQLLREKLNQKNVYYMNPAFDM